MPNSSVRNKILSLLAAYKTAMESQAENGPDAKLAVIANYGDVALTLLEQITGDQNSPTLAQTTITPFDTPQGDMTGIGTISAMIGKREETFANIMTFAGGSITVNLRHLPSVYKKPLTVEVVSTLRSVCDEILAALDGASQKRQFNTEA